jgi:tetratricopeptide (TPR) repeat protein
MSKFSIRNVLSRLAPDVGKSAELHRLSELMLTLRDEGRIGEAYQVFQEFVAKAPQLHQNGDFCVFQAEFELAANNDWQKAQEFIEKAERLDCERDWFYYKVHGDVMSCTGNLERAAADYQRSFDLDPDVSTLTSLAWVLSMSEDERVADVCEQILQEDPDNNCAYICLGRAAVRAGNRSRALSMVRSAEGSAESARDFFEVARLYHELREYGRAIDVYLKANKLGYQDRAGLYASVSACHLSLGHVTEARRWSDLAVRLDPDEEYVQEVWRACNGQTGDSHRLKGDIQPTQ